MKRVLLIVFTLLLFVSCKKEEKKIQEKQNLDFLVDSWERMDNQPGTFTFESWKKINDSSYYGVGYTLKGKDTISKEIMEINKTNNKWNLLVSLPKQTPVQFAISQLNNTSFTAENPENEFPKLINYQFKDNTIFAYIQADSIKIPFTFVPLK